MIKCGCFDSLGYKRSQLMNVYERVMDGISDDRRKNVEGQLDFFGGFGVEEKIRQPMRLPDIPEFTLRERITMEKEVTGLYLSGHPMDENAGAVKKLGAAPIGAIMRDFSGEEHLGKYQDNQMVTVVGVIAALKHKTTKNNSLMSYVTLEDSSGSIELLCFQRALDTGGGYLRVNSAVIITGRISVRDEKEPQIVVDTIRPISDADMMHQNVRVPERKESKLYVKLDSIRNPAYERINKLLVMFPGDQQMILYFEDTKRRQGANCIIHRALVKELKEMLGNENVVVK